MNQKCIACICPLECDQLGCAKEKAGERYMLTIRQEVVAERGFWQVFHTRIVEVNDVIINPKGSHDGKTDKD